MKDEKEADLIIRPRDFGTKFDLATGKHHRVLVRRFRAGVLDFEDVHFHFDSAVLLPDFGDCGVGSADASDANRVTGLAAVRSVYLQAEENPAQKLLIAGHTDRSGSSSYNLQLSTLRADNVLRVLQGDRAGWVKICDGRHQVEDYQQILKWVDAIWGWGCDPGTVDNVLGPKTREAVREFQKQYNAGAAELPPGFSAHIDVDGAVGPQTWGAFFDVYLRVLELILGTDSAGLRAKQSSLKFLDAQKLVGCGEKQPLTANVVANRRSQIDRRVDVIFFDPGEEPLLTCHPDAKSCVPADCELYRGGFFHLVPVPCRPAPSPTSRPLILFPASPTRDAGPAPDAGTAPASAPDGGTAPARDAGASPASAPDGGTAPARDAGASPAPSGGAPASASGAPASGAPPSPPSGNIASARVVVVRKPGANPARTPVQLKVTAAFTGSGTFARSQNNIRFFTALTAGTEITCNGTDNVFTDAQLLAGVTVFADGDRASAAVDDVELSLTLQPSGKKTTAKMTAVELTLDICESRTAAGTDPKALSAADKVDVGRTVHLQDPDNHHGRAMLIVRQVKPAAFAGDLRLAPVDARVRLFAAADEVAASGQTVLANPYAFPASSVPAAGLRFWAEGARISAARRDTGVRLGIDKVEPEGDRVAMTVARLRRLEVRIPATPAHTARMGNSPVAEHVLRRGTTAALDRTNYDVDTASNPPLVLINNSVRAAAPLALSIQVEPTGVPVLWSIQRDTRPAPDGDDAGVIARSPNQLPTLTAGAGSPPTATLLADAIGTFHIRPFIDCNGSGTYTGLDASGTVIDREPFIIMNLVLVGISLHQDNSVAHSGNMVATASGGGVGVRSGSFNIANPAGEGIHMTALADLTGGGGDGRRGLDRVFAGWVNNESANEDIAGSFVDSTAAPPQNHRNFSVFASNRASATGGSPASPNFLPGDPAPALVAPPLLDSGRVGAGAGGDSATLTSSRVRSRTNLALGQRWLVEAIDSPGDGEGATHPGFAAARLVRFRFYLDFLASLCFWTNHQRASGATGNSADRLYAVLRHFTWRMRGEWTISPAGVLAVVTAPSIAISGATTSNPPAAAATMPVEVRPPTGLNLLARDGRA
jgi:hypothetical protein